MNSVTIYIVQWTPESEHEEIDEYVELERPQQPVLIGSFSDLADGRQPPTRLHAQSAIGPTHE